MLLGQGYPLNVCEGLQTSATCPNSSMIAPLLSMTSLCMSKRIWRLVFALFSMPRSSSRDRVWQNSTSEYDVDKMVVTFALRGLEVFEGPDFDGLWGESSPAPRESAGANLLNDGTDLFMATDTLMCVVSPGLAHGCLRCQNSSHGAGSVVILRVGQREVYRMRHRRCVVKV